MIKDNIFEFPIRLGCPLYFGVRYNDYNYAMLMNRPVKLYKRPAKLIICKHNNKLCYYSTMFDERYLTRFFVKESRLCSIDSIVENRIYEHRSWKIYNDEKENIFSTVLKKELSVALNILIYSIMS
jgi:hypothetical protein